MKESLQKKREREEAEIKVEERPENLNGGARHEKAMKERSTEMKQGEKER